jgi:glycosyltransferase involved in cell wall biosynthesis
MRTTADRVASPEPPVDVLVVTYESAATLAETLDAARRLLPIHCLIVVDRPGTDDTAGIARTYGARVLEDTVGLGSARNLALREADTDPVVFLDSDVRIVRPDFFRAARAEYARPSTAAVVGMSVGHRFRYGLPLGLTLIGRAWSLAAGIPDRAQGRETYYLQRAARSSRERVRYVPEAMEHRGTYRRDPRWPEFQGASIRLSSGLDPRELAYAAVVVLLMHMNSGRPANVLYSPVLYAKLLRGFASPERFGHLVRAGGPASPARSSAGRPP